MRVITTQDLYDRFRALYAEKSTRFFDANPSSPGGFSWAVSAINDSVDDLASEVEPIAPDFFGTKRFLLSYVNGVREYALPATFDRVIKVEVTDLGGPPFPTLASIDFEDVGSFTQAGPSAPWLTGGGLGEPLLFYVRGLETGETPIGGSVATTIPTDVIGFDPIPSRSATNNVNVWYEATRTLVTSIDSVTTPDLPADWHALIPLRMCVLAAIADQNPAVAGYQALYDSRLTRLLGEAIRGRSNDPEDIVIVDDM